MAVFEELSSASEFEEQIANIQEQIDNLDDTYATDSDIQGLQGQIDVLGETVAGLGTGGGGASIKTETISLTQLSSYITSYGDKILFVDIKPNQDITATISKAVTTNTGTTFSSEETTLQMNGVRERYVFSNPDNKQLTHSQYYYSKSLVVNGSNCTLNYSYYLVGTDKITFKKGSKTLTASMFTVIVTYIE